jgi:hypothetical protein
VSQHDYDIANASGASVRSDLNNALSAIVSLNSGASAPSTTYADMLWVDTTNGLIKRRNSANSGWLPFGPRSSTMVQAKTGVYTVLPSDFGTLIDCTSGTFDLDLTAAATLGDGFWFMARNSGSGTISIDPNSTENIDGSSTSITLAAGESVIVFCNGSAFKTIGRSVAAASQAEMETGTSVSVYVSPGRAQYHPGVAKAWCNFVGTNTGTFSPTTGHNVASVIRNGTGDYTVNFTTAFSGTSYANALSARLSTGTIGIANGPTAAPGTSSFRFVTVNSSFSVADALFVSAVFWGDQA